MCRPAGHGLLFLLPFTRPLARKVLAYAVARRMSRMGMPTAYARRDGSVIEGLYAIGNTSAAVMGPSYPGAGSTLGPAMTFGYIAARHMTGANE